MIAVPMGAAALSGCVVGFILASKPTEAVVTAILLAAMFCIGALFPRRP